MAFQTEFNFIPPKGYVDPNGVLHREGVMRLTAKDEIAPLQDYRVQKNRAYLVIILLSRVITRLGSADSINPSVIERLFSSDLAYLQEFYRRINEEGSAQIKTQCPACQHEYEIDLGQAWGIVSYPLERIFQEVAYIAYHFHWSLDDILSMEHRERQLWIREISGINKEINESRR
ncbi:MAG: DUF6760 family protein [bacterium]